MKMKLSNHDQMMFYACTNLLKSHSSSFSDIKVISNAGVTTFTSKVLVFLTNPFLREHLMDSDVIFIDEEPCEPVICQDVKDDAPSQSQHFVIKDFNEETKENDGEYQSDNHQYEESNKEQHLCQVCGHIFPNRKLLHKHTSGLSNNSANTRCHICDKQFCNSGNLKRHLVVHTDYMYECSICQVKIKHLKNFRRHIKTHDDQCLKLNCYLCSMSFKSRSNFQRHLKNIHKI